MLIFCSFISSEIQWQTDDENLYTVITSSVIIVLYIYRVCHFNFLRQISWKISKVRKNVSHKSCLTLRKKNNFVINSWQIRFFLELRKNHHFLKWNYIIFSTYYDSFSYSAYKSIQVDKLIVYEIFYTLFWRILTKSLMYLVKYWFFGNNTLIFLCTE